MATPFIQAQFSFVSIFLAAGTTHLIFGLWILFINRFVLSSSFHRLSGIAYILLSTRLLYMVFINMELLPFDDFFWDATIVVPGVLILLAVFDKAYAWLQKTKMQALFFILVLALVWMQTFFNNHALFYIPEISVGLMNFASAFGIARKPMHYFASKYMQKILMVFILLHGMNQFNFIWLSYPFAQTVSIITIDFFLSVAFSLAIVIRGMLLLMEKKISQNRYHLEIFKAAPVGLLVFDRPLMRFEFINEGGREILGYSLEELNALALPSEILHPKDIVLWETIIGPDFGKTVPFDSLRVKSKNGKYIRLHIVRKRFRENPLDSESVKILFGFHNISDLAEKVHKLRPFEELLVNSPSVSFRVYAERPWEVEFVSENIASIGWEKKCFLEKKTSFMKIFCDDDAKFFQSEISKALSQNKFYIKHELAGQTQNGQNRFFSVGVYLPKENMPDANMFECIVEDITEYRNEINELEKREGLFRSIFENTAFGIILVNTVDGVIEMSNSRFATMVGYEKDSIIGKKIDNFIIDGNSHILRRLRVHSEKPYQYSTIMSIVIQHFSGKGFWTNTYFSRLAGSSSPLGIILFEDITFQKKLSDEQSETFQHMPTPLIIFYKDEMNRYRIKSANKAGVDMFGVQIDESLNMAMEKVSMASGKKFSDYLTHLFENLTAKSSKEKEEVLVYFKDKKIYLSLIIFLKKNDRIGLMAEDITATRSLQRELLQVADRERMQIGQDLHDNIGQQLVGVLLFLNSLLSKIAVSNDSKELLPKVSEIIEHVKKISEKIRSYSRGLAPLSIAGSTLGEVISESLVDAERILDVKTEFVNYAGDIELSVDDSSHVYHIIQEFVTNSKKHGEAKFIFCELALQNNMPVLKVRDDGKRKGVVNKKGLGIPTMKHRAAQIDADFNLIFTEKGSRMQVVFLRKSEV